MGEEILPIILCGFITHRPGLSPHSRSPLSVLCESTPLLRLFSAPLPCASSDLSISTVLYEVPTDSVLTLSLLPCPPFAESLHG